MPHKDLSYLHISTGTMIRFFLVIGAFVALYIVSDIIIALLFAVIVASALEPAIAWCQSRRVPRILAVVLIYFLILVGLFLFSYLILPLFFEELHGFSVSYPLLEERVRTGIMQVGTIPFFSIFGSDFQGLLGIVFDKLAGVGNGIVGVASAAFGGAFIFLLVGVFSFYLAAQERGIESFLRLVTPLKQESYIVDLWERAQKKLGRWLRTQMLLGAIVGVLIFFGLTFLGIQHAFIFALITAVFEIIPVVGPILAAVPAVTVAFIASPILGVLTALLYLVIQQTESHVIVPVVMRRTVGLSPLVIVLALLVGGKLGGVFGILLAVPLTAIVAELLDDWDKKKRALLAE